MSQGLAIVLPLIFFFLIDLTLFLNSLRQRTNSKTEKVFASFSGSIMVSQGLTAITYACDYKFISIRMWPQFFINLISLLCMTFASYIWFEYLLMTSRDTHKYLTKKWKFFFFIPVLVQLLAGLPSQITHWVLYIDQWGVYRPGSMYFIQFFGYLYYFAAVVLALLQIRNGKSTVQILYKFSIYVVPIAIGAYLNTRVLRGGYTQIGCSFGAMLMYLEQFMAEINENKRLKSVETLNKRLQEMNDRLVNQINIVGGLSNAYFIVYYVDLTTGDFHPVKDIENSRQIMSECNDIADAIRVCIPNVVMPEDVTKMQKFIDYRTLDNRLGADNTAVLEFHGAFPEWEWCRASWIVAERKDDGKIKRALFAVEEISSSINKRRKRVQEREEEHMLAERRLQTMAEAIHGGFKISKNDTVYTFIMVSEQLAELLGYESSDELMDKGVSLIGVVNPEDAIREMPQAREAIRAGEMYTMHYRMRCKDGSWKNVEDRGRLIRKSNGEDELWSFIVDQDELTKKAEALVAANRANESLEKAQKELEASREAAEAANNAKTEFLFNISHDIRTPMKAIIGYADLMEKHIDDEAKCRDYLAKVKKSSNFLLSLVNNVLEMARIESGKMTLNEEVCKPFDLYEEIASVYSEMMQEKGINFRLNIETKDELYYGDKVKLSQIFLNIISNAYKYTDEGGKISLITRKIPYDRPDYILIQTTVSDTGIGMSKEFIPRIFEEFTREHTYTENKIEGTGLGLPIVKKLVDLMGGTIEVQSELGKGSTFIVTIPHKCADTYTQDSKVAKKPDVARFTGKRILLVEDNELNAEITTEILTEYGFVIEHAEDGIVCIDMLNKARDNYYDLILMDVQMPRLDGYGATQKIRSLDDRIKANIPIIAVTANAFEEDKNNALKAGMNGHLAKPIEIPKLVEVLAEILG